MQLCLVKQLASAATSALSSFLSCLGGPREATMAAELSRASGSRAPTSEGALSADCGWQRCLLSFP